MSDKNKDKAEVRYTPDFCVSQFEDIIGTFERQLNIMAEVQFEIVHKTRIAGSLFRYFTVMSRLQKMLIEWGFLPEGFGK